MEKRKLTTFEEAVDYLYQMPRFTKKNTMEDTKAFLQLLGDPDRKLRIIHVAGTNGKGSVCAYMRSILEASGQRVAVFTSPHLVDIRERFLIAGRMPSREAFLEAFLQIYDRLDWDALEAGNGYHPTFFEYLFFMAMLLFAREEVDWCILETGLGGRLDATNSVFRKELSVITRISLEHVEYLGDTVSAIAGEKAGIMKNDAPLVYSDVEPEASGVFEKRAKELGIKAYPMSKKRYHILKIYKKSIDFSLECRYDDNVPFTISTIAPYQVENAALAVQAIEVLDPEGRITEAQVRQGLKACFWAGRMEEVLPEVYVDGAHNADGVRAFLEAVRVDGCEQRMLLFSVVSDKDYESMLSSIAQSGLFMQIAIAQMQGSRAADTAYLEEIMRRYPGCAYTLYENVSTALQNVIKQQGSARIYIAGSLYLVGEIKELVNHDKF